MNERGIVNRIAYYAIRELEAKDCGKRPRRSKRTGVVVQGIRVRAIVLGGFLRHDRSRPRAFDLCLLMSICINPSHGDGAELSFNNRVYEA